MQENGAWGGVWLCDSVENLLTRTFAFWDNRRPKCWHGRRSSVWGGGGNLPGLLECVADKKEERKEEV